MIAPAKKALAKRAAEVDLAMSVAETSKADEVIKSKRPRLRGRARASVAAKPVVIEGPASPKAPTLSPGTVLTRQYKGKRITVKVLGERQFEYSGKTYRSLSAIANHVTGGHHSGNAWFGLAKRKEKKSKGGAK